MHAFSLLNLPGILLLLVSLLAPPTSPFPVPPPPSTQPASSFQSGFVPVTQNSSLFYWYCPPSRPPSRPSSPPPPLILWLQGGPGVSGLVGLLYEMGPYRLVQDNSSTPASPPSFSLADRAQGAWNHDYGELICIFLYSDYE
ncbi:Peptidase S10, serine carboxypeptidase [Nannochloropsis gaditana]|uniref:Peptidase S10, serine carboxypeptidase n=1 Tax=Nannochloropsis gaditana TaxID=72520 RepID=W7TJH9_9STRA|nr:Peptidase S10, serine carboxypeptidase [Nannochloropsis gaditana]